jgi:hypothetical protein
MHLPAAAPQVLLTSLFEVRSWVMNLSRWILIALLLSISTHSRAESCLSGIPDSVKSTAEQDNWTILQPQDLTGADLKIWKNAHQGQCPGVTTGNFFPKADASFIVALIQGDDQKNLLEKVVLVTQKKERSETAVVISPMQVNSPSVVWKLPPGHYAGIDGTKAATSRDSFVVEKINSSAKQFYYQGTRLQSFVISR